MEEVIDLHNIFCAPGTAAKVISRCMEHYANIFSNCEQANCSQNFFPRLTTITAQREAFPNVDTENMSNYAELEHGCPVTHSQSTIAHASLAVATLAMTVHLSVVFFLKGSVLKLYGSCLLMSMICGLIHNAILFSAAYVTNFIFFESPQPPRNHTHLQRWYPCLITDSVLHYVSLALHISILCGLISRFKAIRVLYSEHCASCTAQGLYSNRTSIVGGLILDHTSLNIPAYKCRSGSSRQRDVNSFSSTTNRLMGNSGAKYEKAQTTGRFSIKPAQSEGSCNYRLLPGECRCPLITCMAKINWNAVGPLLALIFPILPVTFGLWATYNLDLDNSWNPAYGVVTCGGVGSCILAFQWMLYLPLGVIFACELSVIVTVFRRASDYAVIFQQLTLPTVEPRAQFLMITKMALSQMVIWCVAFISNYACLMTMWQLYAISAGLQNLYLLVSFVFSRPFLEIIFKRNDPLGRLKLDNLVMQLPLGAMPMTGIMRPWPSSNLNRPRQVVTTIKNS
ncbi:unnamed protein product [Calicophoron daubneyi]|uniref:G protein-coupled receptor n=1 Tax=Calicophoron daubneyi TaxID=300641 RepID=A0AAV2TAN1_CALDB